MRYPVLGLCGQAGAGKDTIADMLIEEYGGQKVAFAAPLKELAAKFFPHDNVYGPSHKRNEIVSVPGFESGDPAIGPETWAMLNNPNYDPKVVEKWCEEILTEYHWNAGMSARYFLQQLGTELGRQLDPNIWVNRGVQAVEAALDGGASLVIVTDVRFKNEALGLKRLGAKMCRIYANGESIGSHASESEQLTIPKIWFDIHFNNNKSEGLESLRADVLDNINLFLP